MKDKGRSFTSVAERRGRVQLMTLVGASSLLNATLDYGEILRQLMALAAQWVDADRVMLYVLNKERGELCSVVMLSGGMREVRLSLEEGLVGYVARTGETVNVVDAYADPRFSRRIDEEAGYHTRTMLAMPLRDPRGQICGVIQLLNKRQGFFSEDDERYLQALAEHATQALEKARLHAARAADSQRLSFLYCVNSLVTGVDAPGGSLQDEGTAGETRLRDVLMTVVTGAVKALKTEACSILLWDQRRRRLVFVAIASPKAEKVMEVEVPLEGSIAGWVIQNKHAIIVNDAQSDPRHFAGVDEHSDFVTRALLCVPMKVRGDVIGVLQALNKQGDAPFSTVDLQLAQAVVSHAALAIESVQHYESLLRVGEGYER